MNRLLGMLLVSAVAQPAWAASVTASVAVANVAAVNAAVVVNAPEANPQVVVQKSIDSLVTRIVKDRKALQKSPAALSALVDQNITPFVDIPGIARGVMGQYFRQATPEQRERFVATFKQSMIRTYANGLAGYNNQKIVVKPYTPGADMTRAQVDVEVTLESGTLVPVTFQMVRDGAGVWKARNLIVNGLNLGLTFRKRFADVMEQSAGNIDKAIAAWSPDAAAVDVVKAKS
ncbi:MAG: ABC transporter substrate-binding protein [Pseudomonadota bacterium]